MNVRRLLPGLIVLALAGCGTILDGGGTSRMTVTLSSRTIREGQDLQVTVTLTNVSDRRIGYEGNTCPWGLFEVADSRGQRIDPRIEAILCAAYSVTVTLDPGASKTWTQPWTAARYAPSTTNPDPAAPATVRIRGRYWVNGDAAVSTEWVDVTVEPPA